MCHNRAFKLKAGMIAAYAYHLIINKNSDKSATISTMPQDRLSPLPDPLRQTDVHLMIVEPDRWVSRVRDTGAAIMNVHAEACTHLHEISRKERRTYFSHYNWGVALGLNKFHTMKNTHTTPGAAIMNVHAEACTHLHRTVQAIRAAGMKAAVTLNASGSSAPNT